MIQYLGISATRTGAGLGMEIGAAVGTTLGAARTVKGGIQRRSDRSLTSDNNQNFLSKGSYESIDGIGKRGAYVTPVKDYPKAKDTDK